MKTTSSILVITIMLLATNSCTKEGTGGKATITGQVKHHEAPIPEAVVFIKYGVTELPGTDALDYDDETIASSGDGHYKFEELKKGNYYVYSTGYDSTISEIVIGGTPVMIKKKSETIEIDIPVAE